MIKGVLMKKTPYTPRTWVCRKILDFKGMNRMGARHFTLARSLQEKHGHQNSKSKTVSSQVSGLSLHIAVLALNAVELAKIFFAIRKSNMTSSCWRSPVHY